MKADSTIGNVLSDKMVTDVDMLRAAMFHGVRSQLDGSLVVFIDGDRLLHESKAGKSSGNPQ